MNAIHRLIGAGGGQLVSRRLGHENPLLEEQRAVRYRGSSARCDRSLARSFVVELRDAGLSVVLATSSPADEVDIIVDLLDIGDVVTAITTSDDVAEAKPAPDVLPHRVVRGCR